MPSRVLGMKTPCEMIFGKNEFIIPPKVFGCTCFVRDHRPTVRKLDPQAVKCIFIGYSSGQKGYKCWSPSLRRTFVSVDVTFRESVPFYGEKTNLSGLFLDLDSSDTCEVGDEENGTLGTKDVEELRRNTVISGLIPCPVVVSKPTNVERGRTSHAERNL